MFIYSVDEIRTMPDSFRRGLVGELADYIHLLAVWFALAVPVVTLVDAVLRVRTDRLAFLSTEGLVLGTLPVIVFELTGNRPSLGRAFAFFLTAVAIDSALGVALTPLSTPGIAQVVAGVGAVAGGLAVTVSDGLSRAIRILRDVLRRLLPPPAGNR